MGMDCAKFIVDVLAGLAVVIPLVLNLVKYVQQATKEKNWNALMKLTSLDKGTQPFVVCDG